MYQGKNPLLDTYSCAHVKEHKKHHHNNKEEENHPAMKAPVKIDCGKTPPFIKVREAKLVTPSGPYPKAVVVDGKDG